MWVWVSERVVFGIFQFVYMIQSNPRCNTCRVRDCSVLHNCSNEILDILSDNKQYLCFPKGKQLLVEGQHGGGIYFIRSGIAKVKVSGRNGRSLILRLAGAGSVFGNRVSSSLDGQPLSVEAVEDLQVCYISLDLYKQLLEKSPELHDGMIQTLMTEIRQVEIHSIHLTHLSVKERVAETLLHIAEAYHYRPGSNGFRVHLERQDIADLSGTTKEQVSRMLSELENEALINLSGKHFKYLDLDGLRQITALH